MLARHRDQQRSSRVPQLNTSAFLERLLEADGPIWHRWDGNVPALLDALIGAAENEFSSSRESGPRDHEKHLRQRRLLWLLDRLAPETLTCLQPIEATNSHSTLWGRRLPQDRRNELTKFPITPTTPGHWTRRMTLQALILAWCDTCPDDKLHSILDWSEHWRPHSNSTTSAGCMIQRMSSIVVVRTLNPDMNRWRPHSAGVLLGWRSR